MARFISIILLVCTLIGCKSKPPVWEVLIDSKDTTRVFFDTIAFAETVKELLAAGKDESYDYPNKYDNLGNIVSRTICYPESCAITKGDSITIIQMKSHSGYIEVRNYPNCPFSEIYSYYPNGNISSKGKLFNYDLLVGKYYQYNNSGKLMEVKDYDVGYTYTTDSVLLFVKQNGLNTKSKTFGISKGVDKNHKAVWTLKWRTDDFKSHTITVNGMTGEIVDDVVE